MVVIDVAVHVYPYSTTIFLLADSMSHGILNQRLENKWGDEKAIITDIPNYIQYITEALLLQIKILFCMG